MMQLTPTPTELLHIIFQYTPTKHQYSFLYLNPKFKSLYFNNCRNVLLTQMQFYPFAQIKWDTDDEIKAIIHTTGEKYFGRFDERSYDLFCATPFHPSKSLNCGECKYNNNCKCHSYILCPKCQQRTCYGIIEGVFHIFIQYQCVGCDVIWMVCAECSWYDKKPKKIKLLRLINQHNHECFIKISDKFNAHIINDPDSLDDSTFQKYMSGELDAKGGDDEWNFANNTEIVYNRPMFYFSEKYFSCITGPDGGYGSMWYCSGCAQLLVYTDK